MNFGEKFIEWIEVLLKDTIAHVLLNGYISIELLISRGAKQGCPLSGDIYAVYIEVLELALEACPYIHGIPIPGRSTFKSISFADDLTLPLSDRTSLTHVFGICSQFQNATGSKINNDKTQGLKLGNPNLTDPNSTNINWKNKEGIEILGIHFLPDFTHTTHLNWLKRDENPVTKLKISKIIFEGKGFGIKLACVIQDMVHSCSSAITCPRTKDYGTAHIRISLERKHQPNPEEDRIPTER